MAPMHAIAATSSTLTAAPQRTRAVFARAAAATGGAAAIAAIVVLPDTLRRPIVRWLLLLEHVVRKLLFAEAAELPAPAPERGPRMETIVLPQHRPPWMPQSSPGWSAGLQARMAPPAQCAPGGARSNLQRARALDLANPDSWPARFSLALPHDPHRVPEAQAPRIRALWGPDPAPPPAPPPRTPRAVNPETSALRLALRFEAIRRVLADPLPHARRLAERLRHELRRFPELITRYAIAPARTNFRDDADPRLGVDIYVPAFAAQPKLRDSS
jgi:hypothetical protein